MRKKICSILLLIILLLNSSVMTIISTAVEAVGESAKSTNETQEKVSMDLSYTQLTNKVQNEMVITGALERDTEDDPLYENPVITFEMPSEVEKVVINDIKVLYDDELKLGEYEVTQNEVGNQVVKIPLKGKQTKYQTDGINKGTAVRVSANVILKQDIKTADTKIVMTCIDGADSTKTAKCEKTIKVVNSSEIPAIAETIDEEGTKTYANGLLIENKAILGDTVLKDDDIVYEDEIIKYEVKITNTTDKDIDNIKIIGKIPFGMSYVELYDSGFWGDTREYREDETIKEKEIDVGTLKANETGKYYYEVKVGRVDTRPLLYKTVERYKAIMKEKDISDLTEKQLRDLRIKSVNQAVLEVKLDVNEEEKQKTVDRIMTIIDEYGEDSLSENIDRSTDSNSKENTCLLYSVLIGEECVSTYSIQIVKKISELEAYLIPTISRVNKNEWYLDLNIRNKTKETLQTVVTINLPQSFQFENIKSRLLQENGEEEKVDYELSGNILILKWNLEKYEHKLIRITTRARNDIEDEKILYQEVASASAQVNNDIIYKSNQALIKGGIEAVNITQTSEKNGEKLKVYDEITYTFNIQNIGYVRDEFGRYTTINFEDNIPNGLEVIDVQYNDNEVSSEVVDSIKKFNLKSINKKLNAIELNEINNQENEGSPVVKLKINIKTGETSVITIKARVKSIEENEKNEVIENYAIVKGENIKTKQSNIVTNTIFKRSGNVVIPADKTEPTKPTEPTNPTQPTKPTRPTNPENKVYTISGKAWIDENENGKIDEDEKVKVGLQVYLYDITNKKFLTDENGKTKIVKTDKNGKYTFDKVSGGMYYVIVEYDANEYTITDYQKAGVSELTNCDFITKEVIMFKEQKNVGMTNTINLEEDKDNIDIGLVEKKTFDLKMEQFIQKITVTNSKGTKKYNYKDKKLAKVEIHSKEFNVSTIAIEYKIKVTNVGEVSGNVNEIIAEIPSKLDFHSELNSQWSKSMTYNLSNTSYITTEIKPGESIEATLILSKTLDDDSAGTYKNITKIGISENAKHIEDNNKENDTDSTEVLIGISTGIKETIGIIFVILLGLILMALIFIFIKKNHKIFNKKVFLLIVVGVIVSFNSIVEAERVEPYDYRTDFTSKCSGNNQPHYVDGASGTYNCIDPGDTQCSYGDSYTFDHYEHVSDETKYPYFANQQTGEKQGEIKLDGTTITITDQSSFTVNVKYTDTTGAREGNIVITVSDYGGSESVTVPAGSGSIEIPCTSSNEFVPGAKVTAEKKCTGKAIDTSTYRLIYKGEHTGPITRNGNSYMEGPFDSKYEAEAQFYSCIEPITHFNWENVETGYYVVGAHKHLTRADAEAEAERTGDQITIETEEKQIWYVDGYNKLTVQRLEATGKFTKEREIPYEWNDSITFGSENFPKKLMVNKIDTDTGEPLANCKFSISPPTLRGVTEFDGGQTLDMVMPGTYTITEISAPYGYGYDKPLTREVTVAGDFTSVTFEWSNTKYTGNLQIIKIDEETGEPLAGVVFKIPGITYEGGGSDEFVTDGRGCIEIRNILLEGNESRTYNVIEVYNPYYGYVNQTFTVEVKRQRSDDYSFANVLTAPNKLEYAKLSGYVWEDGLIGKKNERNNLYKDNENDINDKLLPGVKVRLYKKQNEEDEEGQLVGETWTDSEGKYSFGNREENRSDRESYSIDNILLVDAKKYYVEFEYNGVKYRNIQLNIDPTQNNASRASEEVASGKSNENSNERQNFNKKFSTITSDSKIDENNNSTGKALDSENKEKRELNYKSLKSHQSSIIYGDKSIYNRTSGEGQFSDAESEAYGYDIYHINATTRENYDFSTYVDTVRNTIGYTDEIKYVNLGLYSREQVDVAIDSDVEKFMLNIDGYEHTYTYNGVKEESFNEQMDVKLRELQNKYYERQLHESSVAYSATEAGENLYAEITYKVYLQNKSSNLQAQIKKLKLDYDSSLILKSYNYYNETNQKRSEIIGINEEIPTIQDGKLRETIIDLEQIRDMKESGYSPIIIANEKNVLEITFRINANTIAEIVNNPEGIKFDFMAEVESYSTYANNEENAYRREDGTYAYASIDKNSAAGNTPVEIDNNKFITDKFENDTTIAPTFKLSKGSQTVISGIVYEDSPENRNVTVNDTEVSERVGDGKYNSQNEQNENVMRNVLVELIKVSKEADYTADSARDSSQKQKQVYNQDDNNIAHLYKTPTNNDDPVDTGVIARTYTKKDGTYEFSGVIPGKYVIRFVYGKNMQEIDSNGKYTGGNTHTTTIYDKSGNPLKEIEAREYKSTIITGDYISTALNITNGKEELNGDYSWFLNDKDENGTRYSDAVDDVEYRAQLEKDATVDNGIVTGSKEYVYTEMQAHTAYFKLGVEADDNHNEVNSATLTTDGKGTLDYTYSIKNIDLGIIERPEVDLKVDKQITGLKVSLGNGQVLINGNPQRDKLPYVRTGLDDFVPIEMDTEILHGATIEEEYTITIKNNSQLDYAIYPILSGETFDSDIIARRRDYYYYGNTDRLSDAEKQKAVTTRISVLGDYLGSELTADESTMTGENWGAKTIEDITNLLSENSKKAIKDGKYTIYTTGTFADPDTNIVTIGSSKSIKYKVSKLLSTTADTMRYTNDVEILEYLGYSPTKNTIPGNLIPGKPKEDDEDFVRTTITPPTGTIISRWLYVTTAVAGLILVGATIIFIKKRILVK